MNIITKGLIKLFLVLLIAQAVFPTLVSAEGSVDFVDYPGYRLMFFAERQQQTKVFANEGEFINFGASHVGITGGFIRVFRPDGTLHSTYNNTGISQGLAIINNDVEELNGPTGGGTTLGNGYVPGVVEVGAGETGAWTVTFEFPIYTNGVFDNLMNDEPWDRNLDQPLNQRCVLSWDVTISQGGAGNNNGTLIDGRVYTNEYQSIVSLNGNVTSPSFYVLTPDGFQYKVDYHDVDPWGFPIFSNNWGIVNGNVQPTYSSWEDADITRSADIASWVAGNTYIYEPQAEDTEDIINNKIFFNMPNSDLPATTITTDIYRNNTHTTWLFSEPPMVDVEIQEVQFYANDVNNTGDPIFNAFDPILGAFLSFTSTLNGTTRLDLDLNFDGDFDDAEDVALFKRVEGGVLDSVYWDGLNGLGEQTFAPAQDIQLLYQVSFYGGEMHVMMGDIENDLGGVTFTRVNGNGAPVDTFYYDHRMIGGTASGGVTTGAPQPTTTPFTYSNNFGNRKTLDYWTYIGLTTEQDIFIIDVVDDLNDLVVDSDGDSIRDNDDIDDDNDGIPDALEYCTGAAAFSCLPNGADPSGDFDEDGVLNFMDANDPDYTNPCIDTDNDGLCDNLPTAFDFDGDGVPNHLDLDSDNDGITDLEEADHGQIDANGDGVIDGENAAFGLNGLYNPLATNADSFDATANYTPSEVDQDGFPDFLDLDADNDGIFDIKESGHNLLTDSDNNGMGDGVFPLSLDTHGILSDINPDITGNPIPQPLNSDNDSVEDYRDRDSDNDGITDVLEGGNLDSDNDGVVGTGMATVDDFGVVVIDGTNTPVIYATSNVPDTDNDGIEDYLDLDSDNDGINDVVEGGNLDADNDGIIGTGTPTVDDFGMAANIGVTSNPPDSDDDGIYNFLDLDSDNDGINDVVEGGNLDEDNDGIIGTGSPTVNENGQATVGGDVTTTSNPLDSDDDGVEDYLDLDSDNDGINDVVEGGNLDEDNDGIVGTGSPTVNENGQPVGGNGMIASTSNPLDSDDDGVQDYLDLDSDNDGINDVVEGGNLDEDNDGIVGTGTPTVNEDGQPLGDNGMIASTSDPLDSDDDGVQDYLDLDSDNDGINDVVEGGNLDADNDGIVGIGIPTVNENGQPLGGNGMIASTSNPLDSDGDNVPDYLDLDSDNDGINDVIEGGADDPDNDGIVGTGDPEVNDDGQPTINGDIISTSNPLDSDDDGVQDYLDLDSDNDGINDVVEGGNLDEDNDGIVGTGTPTVNEDGQPIGDDGLTASTSDPLDTDGDGVEDYLDLDSDNDGINDVIEGGADDPDNDGIVGTGDPVVNDDGQPTINGDVISTSNPTDTDGNGDPDYIDLDSDDDGINDVIEGGADDPDNDGIVGTGDPVVNDDGQPTINGDVVSTSNPTDTDGNGDPDFQDLDSDDDGLMDTDECNGGSPCLDFDGDGTPDFQDIDSDDDGINDDYECPNGVPCPDSDGDGNTDHHDLDSDDDGIQDEDECPNGAPCPDTDNDGDDDYVDVDSDDDGALDEDECPNGAPCPDFDGDGDPDQLDPDCTILVDDALIAGTNSVCEGTDIELTVTNSNAYFDAYPNSDIQFIWSDNDIEYNTGTDPVLSIPTNEQSTDQSFTVSVLIDGCISNPSPALLVDVVSIPQAEITPNATSVCQGEEITLSGNTGTGLNYEWYLISTDGNILVGSEQELLISNVASSGTYELQISSDDCTEVSAALVAVEVNPTPMIELTSSTQSFCSNEDIVVTASASNITGDVTYTWTGPNGTFTETVDAAQPFEWTVGAANGANAGMYELTLQTAEGCISSTQAVMVEIADALATPELSVSEDALCVGNELTLSIENTSYSNVSYEWLYEGNSIVVTNEPSFTLPNVSTENTGAYSVEITSNNCGSVQSLSVPVEVFAALEIPMIDNSTSLSAACEGENVLLQVMNEQPEAIYTWFGPQGEMLPDQGTNATYTLANIKQDDAGLYFVEIEVDSANEDCNTQTSETTMVEVAEPIETTVIAATNNEVCENETIILELINNQDLVSMNTASFEWHFIDNDGSDTVFETTSSPILTIENATTSNSGTYYVQLTVDGCSSSEFASLNVSVSATPDITAEANFEEVPCDASAIALIGNQPTVGTGQWLDINGEPVGIDGEIIVNVNNLQQEDYQFIWALSNGACVNYSMDTISYTNTVPLAANAGEDVDHCEESYNLNAVPAISTVISEWESPQDLVFDDPFSANAQVSNLQPGENIIIWTLSEPDCPDFSVDTIIVTYFPTTDIADAGLDDNPCSSDEYQLNAMMPEFGFGQWTVPMNSNASIDNVNQPNTMVNDLEEGENIFIWQLSNDNCENYSVDTVIISYTPPVDEATLAMDAQTYACFETATGTLTLEAETPQLATGTWAQTIGPSTATIIDENESTTIVGDLEEGVYVFTWTLTQGDCGELGSEAVMIDISVIPNDQASVVNNDMITCSDSEVMIEAEQPQTAEGFWMPLTEGLMVADDDNAITQVSGLQPGENQIAWMLSYDNCENYSTDVLTIFFQEGVTTTEDNYNVVSGTSLSDVNILDNDSYNEDGNWSVAVVNTPENGQLNVSETGTVTYVANDGFVGTDVFTYELCNEDCDDCQEATVTIEVMPDPNATCFVPNIITPNDDGFNDALVIPCTDQFPDNYIIIFNRWGDKVYEREQYQNDWQGEYNDIMLPAGTYFYIFKQDKNANDALQGYISIMR